MPIDTNFDKVVEFNERMEQLEDFGLYSRLIGEEYIEFVDALTNFCCDMGDLGLEANLLKEAVDLLYVTYGFLWAMGYDADKLFDIVHKSNMSKLGPNGKPIKDENGKVLKGPNYKPPLGDIKDYIIATNKKYYGVNDE